MAWVAAMLAVLAVGLLGWQAMTTVRPSHQLSSRNVPVATETPLLDRNAERQPSETPRVGGPGGQVGDAP
jgi:hypothetical protein